MAWISDPPPYSQTVAVCIWRNISEHFIPTAHFGHASIKLRGTNVIGNSAYISWWPPMGMGAGMGDAFTQMVGDQPGLKNHDLFHDAFAEMPQTTRWRLEAGPGQDILVDPNNPKDRAVAPRETPTPPVGYENWVRYQGYDEPKETQTQHDDEWVQEPDEVIEIPGLNAGNCYFGLSLRRMATWWNTWRNVDPTTTVPQQYYQLASKTNSCAGAASGALGAGGGEAYKSRPGVLLYMAPNDILDWAGDIDREINWLNHKMRDFLRAGDRKHPGIFGRPIEGANLTRGDLLDLASWKDRSSEDMAVRPMLLRDVDKALRDYHRLDWMDAFPNKLKSLVQVFRKVNDFRERNRDSSRLFAVYYLGGQIATFLQTDETQWR